MLPEPPAGDEYFDTPARSERLQLLLHLVYNVAAPVYLRGPAGAGKSMTAANLAARYIAIGTLKPGDESPIDNVIAILNDPQYKAAGTRVAQRDEIWKNVQAMFDFDEISRRTVARNWSDFTDAEKAAFTDVFARFLGNTYIDKIQGEYHNEKIVYLDQAFLAGIGNYLRTEILFDAGARIPIERYQRLDLKAAELSGDPFFGLKGADYFRPAHLGALGFAWLASSTLRDALIAAGIAVYSPDRIAELARALETSA